MRIIVHGGAGEIPDEPEPRQDVLDEAANAGVAESDPLSAVESAVRVLESNRRFNAGVGGAVQSDGVVRTDAGIMLSDRQAGAASGMTGVEHAVSVARAVLEETPHVLLSGEPAVDFAADVGVETGVDLFTEDTRERWEAADAPEGSPTEHLSWLADRFGGSTSDPTAKASDGCLSPGSLDRSAHDADLPGHDTVGAVATDGETFASATSTGGRWFALAGRVGDVPQIGSGFYASPAGGASTTGAGEDIARVTLARRAVRHVERGCDAQTAADLAIQEFGELTGSSAGVILLDDEGFGSAFNADEMQTSTASR
ncbi:asparaginase [Haloferax mediterranei ATCC 33500]|uniref:Plant-type L-asparaginase n=1 Tax=Haloferax mediterranei (strain ATCC 33500 / DSM 1411 / JCM 8866 / NBRC 14739 / NCIMB 2177 / R-4) TaxID=523841 RepID=I3R7T2_HALMT|nr:isoaspartyl peptidase/L-asparaginase [Haloferax mediterranei]AFK20292.1 L-asparaginase [Haloferax mediterranei ATCC 33500]AHZ23661.1 asparaginase [Haloferax mediterranei ATCC 33500]ELZ99148.1 L-asparaginase [Haloferax mediterranei ATCC 33500]MDX5986953.1 isoaspartyl peptidase/L-asparaginase [Haloferax mediterranei ATCC 33500]QCQ76272.1 asparaginase [Haloferax mediterranei ATCC 33500]